MVSRRINANQRGDRVSNKKKLKKKNKQRISYFSHLGNFSQSAETLFDSQLQTTRSHLILDVWPKEIGMFVIKKIESKPVSSLFA